MESKLKELIILLVCFLCSLTEVSANGFYISHQGARAAGMANAFIARASDPSAIWYNPAGISQLKGFQIYGGGNLIDTGARSYYSVYRDRTLAADPFSTILPNLYVSYRLTDNIGLGLSINSPFNYEITWPQTSEVEHLVYVLSNLELRSLAVSSAAAVQLSKNFSLGIGISFYSFTLNGQYHYPYDTDVLVTLLTNGEVMSTPDILFDLNRFGARTIGFFAGVKWEMVPGLYCGATFRRGRPLTFDSGDVNAWEPEVSNPYASAWLAELFPDSPEQNAVVSFSLIDQFSAGIALDIGDSLELEVDLSLVFWSQMDTFDIDYVKNTSFRSFWSGYFDIESPTKFRDAVSLQLGGEYRLSPVLDLRAGAFKHGTPVTDSNLSPSFPFGQGSGFTLGIGIHVHKFTIDAAYVYTFISEIEDVNDQLLRWGDNSQKYPSRRDHCFILNAGTRF
jgi:long-chain fatty acid transport protein